MGKRTSKRSTVEQIDSLNQAALAGCRRVIRARVIREFLDIRHANTFEKYVQSGAWGEPFTIDDGIVAERYFLFDVFKAWLDRRIANKDSEKNLANATAQSLLRRK